MAHNTKYRLDFTNQLNEDYSILFKRKDYVGDYQLLTGGDDALVIKSLNDDDDRFSPILSKEVTIVIHIGVDQNIGIENFLSDEEDDWLIEIYPVDGGPAIFIGYLVVEDSSEPFYDRPFQITLRASDGLALLKDVDFPVPLGGGLLSVIDYLGYILKQINSTINFRTYFAIRHDSMTTDDPLSQLQIDTRTFEDDDIYTVLEKLMSDLQCRIFFENGYWHIIGIHQYLQNAGYKYTEYDTDAIEVNTGIVTALAAIGKDEGIYAINKDATIYYKVASKSVEKTFNYELPSKLVCNQDFISGDAIVTYNEVISSSILDKSIIPAVNLQTKGYDAYCWEHHNGTPENVGGATAYSVLPEAVPAKRAFVRSVLDMLGYEKDRFLVIDNEQGKLSYMKATTFRADVSDIVQLSVSARTRVGNTHAQPIMFLLLYGDDGSHWALNTVGDGSLPGNYPIWRTTTATFRDPSGGRPWIVPDNIGLTDYTDWTTFSVNNNISGVVSPAKLPVSGTLQLLLACQTLSGTDPQEYWFKNLNITVLPFLNGAYTQLKGDYNIYSQNLNINSKIEKDVNLSDSPKQMIKGALFVNNKLATPEWRRAGINESFRLTQLTAMLEYALNDRQFQKIEGNFKGIVYILNDSPINFGFLPQYKFSDYPSKLYMLTSMECNYVKGTWRGVLVEVEQNPVPLFDTYTFEYLFE